MHIIKAGIEVMSESNPANDSVKQVALIPPIRFGFVNPGLIRGAYPTLRNFRFLSRLQLKTIISMTPEAPTQDLVLFAEMAGIKLVHFPISRMSALSDSMQSTLITALNICIEAKNHPVYIHCLDGRRITSLLVLLLRRVQGWVPLAALTEYWRYQVTFRSPVPTLEVEKTSRELEVFAAQVSEVVLPESLPKWLWGGDRNATVVGVSFKVSQPITVVASGSGGVLSSSNSASGNNIGASGGPAGVGSSGSSGNVGSLGTIAEVVVIPTNTEEAAAVALNSAAQSI